MKNIKILYSIILAVVLFVIAYFIWNNTIATTKFENKITVPYINTLEEINGGNRIPRSTNEDGSLKFDGIYGWTSGFFGGNLWFLYELTGDEKWKNEAIYWTEALDTIKMFTGSHDIGLMINCSYGNAFRITGNEAYKNVIIQTAESLSSRFNPTVASIKSWNYRKALDDDTEWFFPVGISNMVNLELLFYASKLSGNSKYKEIAVTHALTTMKNHYRSDYSCYHMVDFDVENGKALDKGTTLGLTDESSWARGQAWGLYGFVMCYRETGDIRFLNFSENIAAYIMNSPLIPDDKVPYWDYQVDQDDYNPVWDYQPEKYPETPRDVSAATITASALFELSTLVDDGKSYFSYANKILESVSSPPYCSPEDETNYFYLTHSVGSIPKDNEVSCPASYADYYYFEALLRKQKIEKNRE